MPELPEVETVRRGLEPVLEGARLSRVLAEQGFKVESSQCALDDDDVPPYRGRLLHYRRGQLA